MDHPPCSSAKYRIIMIMIILMMMVIYDNNNDNGNSNNHNDNANNHNNNNDNDYNNENNDDDDDDNDDDDNSNFNHKKRLIQQTTCPKHQNLPCQSPMFKISCKRSPLVSACEHFTPTVCFIFPLFLTSYQQPPTAWSTDLYVHCMYNAVACMASVFV